MKKMLYMFCLGYLAFFISSCHKDKNTVTTPPAGSILLWSNVHVVDPTQWILQGSANGTYSFSFTPTTPNIDVQPGDILVGITNGGYIRKVVKSSVIGSYYNISTVAGTMSDVFKSGTFTLQVPLHDSSQSNSGVFRTLSNFPLYKKSNYAVNLIHGSFDIQPSFAITFSFDSSGLTNFQMSTSNSTLRDSVRIAVHGSEPYSWSHDTTLSSFRSSSIQYVQAYGNISVPIVIQLNDNIVAQASGGTATYNLPPSDLIVDWAANSAFNAGLHFTANTWQPIHNMTTTNSATIDSPYNLQNDRLFINFVSQITSIFYGVAGPSFNLALNGDILGTARYAPGYTRRTDAWSAELEAQTVPPVFGRNMGTFSQSYISDSVFFQTPYQVIKLSGDTQSGLIAQQLPVPLVVKVVSSSGIPVSNISVYFGVVGAGSGTIGGGYTSITLLTDPNGEAQVSWTLGSQQAQSGPQIVTAGVYDGNQTSINGSLATFKAFAH